MTTTLQHQIALPRRTPARHVPLIGSLLTWSAAYREYYRMKALDAAALTDMGLTEAERDAVTVSQIVARMRG